MRNILKTLYHDATKFYVSKPFPRRGEEFEIKIRVIKNDKIKGIYLRYRHLGEERIDKMNFSYEKNGLEYYTTKVKCFEDIFSYHFNVATEDTIYSYTQYAVEDFRRDNSTNFKILMDYKAPSWMNKTVFYQIMPDRFYNARPDLTIKPGSYTYQGSKPINMEWDEIPLDYEDSKCMDFYGGDLYGVKEKLDYLQDLGINAIYFNPLFTSPTMHKYDALDYFEIDPSLGGEEALIELINEMKKRDMKIVLDISINHTSSSAKWFNKDGEFYEKSIGAYNNLDSNERDFYFINDDGSYHAWAGVPTMPTLNYGSEKLRNIIYKGEHSVLKKYLNESFNIDGWRFDVADVMARNEKLNVYNEVWEEINKEIKDTNSEALILAEEWQDSSEMYNGRRWDSTMNYFSCELPIREFAGEKDVFTRRNPDLAKIDYKFNARQLKGRIVQFLKNQPTQIQYQMFNLIDSHDVTRLHNNPKIDYEVYKGAVITLFSLPGAVNVYYGDEKYLDGRIDSNEGCRYPMNWNDQLTSIQQETFDLYKKLIQLKTTNEALQFGGYKILFAEGDVFVSARFTEDELFIFTWTKSEEKEKIEIDLRQFGLYNELETIIGYGDFRIQDKTLILELQPKISSVLRIR